MSTCVSRNRESRNSIEVADTKMKGAEKANVQGITLSLFPITKEISREDKCIYIFICSSLIIGLFSPLCVRGGGLEKKNNLVG